MTQGDVSLKPDHSEEEGGIERLHQQADKGTVTNTVFRNAEVNEYQKDQPEGVTVAARESRLSSGEGESHINTKNLFSHPFKKHAHI